MRSFDPPRSIFYIPVASHGRDRSEARHRENANTFKGLAGHSGHIKARISLKRTKADIVARPGITGQIVMPSMKHR